MSDLSRLDSGAEALATIFRYLSLVVEDLPPQVVSRALSLAAPEAKDSLMTTLAERWKAEAFAEGLEQGLARGVEQGLARGVEQGLARGVEQGLARGVEQGLARGVEQGLARGQAAGARQILRRLLELKFGAVSEGTEARLEAASEAQLERWAGRVLTAHSVAEVMSD